MSATHLSSALRRTLVFVMTGALFYSPLASDAGTSLHDLLVALWLMGAAHPTALALALLSIWTLFWSCVWFFKYGGRPSTNRRVMARLDYYLQPAMRWTRHD